MPESISQMRPELSATPAAAELRRKAEAQRKLRQNLFPRRAVHARDAKTAIRQGAIGLLRTNDLAVGRRFRRYTVNLAESRGSRSEEHTSELQSRFGTP